MEQNLFVLQGKTFTVELVSSFGSSIYGWCIKGLPKDFVLLHAYDEKIGPLGMPGAPVLQKFIFGVASAQNIENEIEFVLIDHCQLNMIADKFTAYVKIVPDDGQNFTPYSENANITYGYSCSANETYNAIHKYGYPCGVNDANLKYGYACQVNDANLKYGYPCQINDANLKYGYPCTQQEAMKDARPYGMVYNTPFIPKNQINPGVKYGYPGCF